MRIMQNELEILRDVTSKFSGAGIQYMLTGSFALNYYAEPRMTRDIDLVVALEPKDAERVIALFQDEYYVPRDAVVRAVANETLFNLIHTDKIIKVDCIIRNGSDYRRLEFERRQQVVIEGISVWIVSREDLIISKPGWARDSHSEFQLRDVRDLLKSGYDATYMDTWSERVGVSALLREAGCE